MESFTPVRTGFSSIKLAAIPPPRETQALVKPLTGSLAFRFDLNAERATAIRASQ